MSTEVINKTDDESTTTKKITIHAGKDVETGEAYISTIPYPVRIFKTLLVALIWAVITFVNFLTPLLHIVAGPLSILAGAYFSWRAFKGNKKVIGGQGICPGCKKEFDIMTGKYTFPTSDTCTHCGREVVLNEEVYVSRRNKHRGAQPATSSAESRPTLLLTHRCSA